MSDFNAFVVDVGVAPDDFPIITDAVAMTKETCEHTLLKRPSLKLV